MKRVSRKRKTTPSDLIKKVLAQACDKGTIDHDVHVKLFSDIYHDMDKLCQ